MIAKPNLNQSWLKASIARFALLFSFIFILLFSCQPDRASADEHIFQSPDRQQFSMTFSDGPEVQKMIDDQSIRCESCVLEVVTKDGLGALAITTQSEFSDALIDLPKLLGHTIDFTKARYLAAKIWMPEDSWISAIKFNFGDTLGNYGGFQEFYNNFHGNYGQWLDFVVDIQEIEAPFQNWSGTKNPLSETSRLAINPYNADQANPSTVYIHALQLSNKKPLGEFLPALVERPDFAENLPFKVDFDDINYLKQLTAYRSFETTNQSFAKGIAGNESRAIRLKDKPGNKFICWLPVFTKFTGKPIDFTKAKVIQFRYYIPEKSDDFDGANLYLTTQHWDDILLDSMAITGFQKGSWQTMQVNIADLDLQQVKGDQLVLPNVHELRIDLNYYPDNRDVELWMDDFVIQ